MPQQFAPLQPGDNRPEEAGTVESLPLGGVLEMLCALGVEYAFVVALEPRVEVLWSNEASARLGLGVGMGEGELVRVAPAHGQVVLDQLLAMEAGGVLEPRHVQVCLHGLRHHLEVRVGVMAHEGRRLAVGTAHDVTVLDTEQAERQKMAQRLRQAERLESVGRLASGIAHEINTPTQYVSANVTFVREAIADVALMLAAWRPLVEGHPERGPSAEDLEDFDELWAELPGALEEATEGLAQIARIVSAMKHYAHPGVARPMRVDLNTVLRGAMTVAQHEIKAVAVVVDELDPDLPGVSCFPGELGQVFLNLLVNAAHAIQSAGRGERGTIVVRSAPLGHDRVRVEVCDDGPGIPPEVQPHVFEAFFTTKPPGKGTGQGLSMAWASVVERHGGRLEFRSDSRGTTFRCELPIELEGR